MSDKDYSGCDNYNKSKCRIPEFRGPYKLTNQKCADVENCYYKQLQAKSDECEELRDKNKRQTLTVIDLSTMNKCLIDECKNCTKEQENTALKQQLDTAVEALEKITTKIKFNL